MTTDRILAIVALVGVIAFYLPIILLVPEPDLIVVLLVVTVMMIYDFWTELRPDKKNGN